MTCSELTKALLQMSFSELASRPEVERHRRECAGCHALLAFLAEDPAQDMPNSALLHKLLASVQADLRPVRPLPAAGYFFLAFAATFVAITAIGVYRTDPYGWDLLNAAQRTAIFAFLAASASLLCFSLVRQMIPGSRHTLSPSTLPTGIIVGLALVLAAIFRISFEPNFFADGIVCLKVGMPYGIPAALVFFWLLRRGAVLSRRFTGAAAGALAGLVGMTVLEVHCPIFDLVHIIVWHLGLVVIGASLGMAFGAATKVFASYHGSVWLQ